VAACGIPRIDQLLGSTSTATVGPGDADALAVGAVQDLLIGQGFNGLPGPLGAQRGVFGPRTAQCVKDFQQQCGLTSNGSVDAPTLRKLIDRPAAAPRM
jgi:peptidoglycan hydrolase-like protein with peptidoglycan-binding domain